MNKKEISEIKKRLNKINPFFCTMPWLHASVYLHNGSTHSCYHTPVHKISVDEIKKDPSALHNTVQKKKLRNDKLNGIQSNECKFCWNVESLSSDLTSDRILLNGVKYASKEIENISAIKFDTNVNPKYLIISFGNICNFRCGYCNPNSSSKWVEEITKHGSYNTSDNYHNIDGLEIINEDNNPYVEAFWKWWPNLSKDLYTLKLTGGEPLLNSKTMKLLSIIENYPIPNTKISINTNFGVSNNRIKKFLNQITNLKKYNKIKEFRLFASIDNWGKKAEYIRYGLDTALWEKNCISTMNANIEVNIISTLNILSVTSFKKLLEKIIEWRTISGFHAIRFNSPHLINPLYWSVRILPKNFNYYMDEIEDFVNDNKNMFRDDEHAIIKRISSYVKEYKIIGDELIKAKKDFYIFFTENDKRLKTNFLETFPEYKTFYFECKDLYNEKI